MANAMALLCSPEHGKRMPERNGKRMPEENGKEHSNRNAVAIRASEMSTAEVSGLETEGVWGGAGAAEARYAEDL
jgi:hypothetical protein